MSDKVMGGDGVVTKGRISTMHTKTAVALQGGGSKPPLAPADLLVSACEPKRRYHRRAPATQPEQVAFVRVVGERLKLARELNALSLAEAAKRLGFATQASLSKLETAKHVATIPLYVLADAAKMYEVSADYLLGLTDDLKQQARVQISRQTGAWLQTSLERSHRAQMEMLCLLHEEIVVALTGLRDVSLLVQDIDTAVTRFRELNPRFDGMRGGSPVLHSTQEAMKGVARTAAAVTKFKAMMQAAGLSSAMPSAQAQMNFGD